MNTIDPKNNPEVSPLTYNFKNKQPRIESRISPITKINTVSSPSPVLNNTLVARPDLSGVGDNIEKGSKGAGGKTVAAGAVTALQETPSIIENLSRDPTNQKEAGSKVLSLAASGATIGATVGGPWGALIGGVVGAGVGLVSNIGYAKKETKKQDEITSKNLTQIENERKRLFYDTRNAEQIEASKNIYLRANGYS